jgi:hypothetical protein
MNHYRAATHSLSHAVIIAQRIAIAVLLFGILMRDAEPDDAVWRPIDLVPSDPKLGWVFSLWNSPADCVLCKAVTKLALAQAVKEPSTCRLLDSAAAVAAGFTKPIWRLADLKQHVDLVRRVIALENASSYPQVWDDEGRPVGSDSFLTEAFWRRYEPQIAPLLDSGDVRFETTAFDADNDGKPDTLYRLTSIGPVDFKPGNGWKLVGCDQETKSTFLFADPTESPELAELFRRMNYSRTDVFQFEGKPYLWGTIISTTAVVWQIRYSSGDHRLYKKEVFQGHFMQ